MKALCWHGKSDVRYDTVPDPRIEDPRDVIIEVTSCAICGSDLHLYDGYMPTMESGDILGHETMGRVVEIGAAITKLKVGDRVVVPFNIACGECFFCQKSLFSLCDRSNPNAEMAAKMMGHSPSGLFGYSHLLGGYSGGQADYLRVPFADVGPIKVPDGMPDEQVLFLSDIFPTGYMAAENAGIETGDTVAVWGCGPVGQFAMQSAWLLGAGRVIAIDRVPERLAMAETHGRAETVNFDDHDVYERLMEMTKGRGPDRCIDAVGAEAHGGGSLDAVYDKVKAAVYLATDRAHVLREAIMCCRKGGTLSVPGVYIGMVDKLPFGALMNKGLTLRTGQTHTHRYLQPLLEKIVDGTIDPTFVITHRAGLEEGPCNGRSTGAAVQGPVPAELRQGRAGHRALGRGHVFRRQSLVSDDPRLRRAALPSRRRHRRGRAVRQAEAWMALLREVAPVGDALPEQFDRTTGRACGALELTWSASAFLTAATARAQAIAARR